MKPTTDATMKAVAYDRYGPPDVLEYRDADKPLPKAGQVLVKVHATSVNAADWHLLRADPFIARLYSGLFRPKRPILGFDVAGRVEAAGPGVQGLRPGDAVFGELSGSGFGAFAEYACGRAEDLLPMPAGLTFAEAAASPLAGMTALRALRKAPVRPGRKVLVHGAGGGVGTFAVQIAKALGDEVTAVCGPGNADRVRDLGADRVLDYSRQDFAADGGRYDLILGVNGSRSLAEYRRALLPGGTYAMIGGSNRQMFQGAVLGPWVSRFGNGKVVPVSAKSDRKDLAFLAELLAAGKVKPAIDRRYPLQEVPAAIRHIETGHARGKIVIDVFAE